MNQEIKYQEIENQKIENQNRTNRDKKKIRKQILSIRNQLTKEAIEMGGQRAADLLCQRQEWKECKTIYLYASYQCEVSTKEILNQCILSDKRIGFPLVIDKKRMEFYEITSKEDLKEGFHGIMEPNARSKILNEPGLMIIPGLAFDAFGNRIGYGGGYYDRYLSTHIMRHKLGLAYSFQIIDSIDSDIFDEKLDGVISISLPTYDKER